MRVVFFGNHTVGVAALKSLICEVCVVGVVAHPQDPEDGVRYQSVFDFSKSASIPAIRGAANSDEVQGFLRDCQPDLIWITDYRYLLPKSLLEIPHEGGVNLHPSLLPKYRGRAPVNWAIIGGEKKIGLTAHVLTEGMDDGDIIEQESFELTDDEDVGDALDKLLPIYSSITRTVIRYYVKGEIPLRKQDESLAASFPRRKPSDGRIDWNQPVGKVRDLVRAVAYPYPGAFTESKHGRVYIWKAVIKMNESVIKKTPGEILNVATGSFVVACGVGELLVTSYTVDGDERIMLKEEVIVG